MRPQELCVVSFSRHVSASVPVVLQEKYANASTGQEQDGGKPDEGGCATLCSSTEAAKASRAPLNSRIF